MEDKTDLILCQSYVEWQAFAHECKKNAIPDTTVVITSYSCQKAELEAVDPIELDI